MVLLAAKPDSNAVDRRSYYRANRAGAMLMLIALFQGVIPAIIYALLRANGASPEAEAWGLPYSTYLSLYLGMYLLVMLVPTVISRRLLMPDRTRLSALNLSSDRRLSVVLCGVALCLLANMLAAVLNSAVLHAEVVLPRDATDGSFFTLISELVVFAAVPAVVEEWLLRATVLQTLRPLGDGLAVITSSVLFGLMHANLRQAPYALLMGLILGFFFLYTDNLKLCIVIHAVANALAVITNYVLRFTPSDVFDFWQLGVKIVVLLLGTLAALWLWRHPLGRRRPPPKTSVAARCTALFSAPLLWTAIVLMILPLFF